MLEDYRWKDPGPVPQFTSLGHATRWIAWGHRFLDYLDQQATDDHPEIDGPEYNHAKSRLSLAIRHGNISAFGNLEVFDSGHSVFGKQVHLSEDDWDKFLGRYRLDVDGSEEGRIFVGHHIPIQGTLWQKKFVDWQSNCIQYDAGHLQGRFLTVQIDVRKLLKCFSRLHKEPMLVSGAPDREVEREADLSPKERSSLLKMVIGMAVEGYRYDPRKLRNPATSDIAGDLDKLGVPLDPDTILKWLRQGAELLPPDDPDQ